jgi:hypothetical protein
MSTRMHATIPHWVASSLFQYSRCGLEAVLDCTASSNLSERSCACMCLIEVRELHVSMSGTCY